MPEVVQKLAMTYLRDRMFDKARIIKKPTFIIWLGSCELTDKYGAYIFLKENQNEADHTGLYQNTRKLKGALLRKNRRAVITFLECPYINIVKHNAHKGHPNPKLFEGDQIKLEANIKKLNTKIRYINRFFINSHIANDMTYSTKKRRQPRKTHINYDLLYDGLHPGKTLCNLWLQKIKRMIIEQ